ncbi:universal stress protein [Salinibaculum salinum]|uniref:universal stress protein n=1 Tax=Salinibaculum salinum TaxID=3131996 RepID=UPI0030ED1561
MTTYLIGTDGESASTAICDHLESRLTADDRVRAVYATSSADEEARQAVQLIEDRLGSIAPVDAGVVDFGREGGPVMTLLAEADSTDADQMVVGLRRHSRTERIIVGSVSHTLLEKVAIPILLVPLPEYQTPAE